MAVMSEMLDNLTLKETIICPDAMGAQTGTAEQIISPEAEYVLCLKENHKHLFLDTRNTFTGKYTRFVYSTEKDGTSPLLPFKGRICRADG